MCLVLFVALGRWVTHHPLSRTDALGAALRANNVALAIAFTDSGYGLTLSIIGFVSVVAALGLRFPVRIPLVILGSQLVSQFVLNVAKGLFDRARPNAWIYRHEPGFSYPSGHATTAVVFYGAWLVVIWNTSLPLGVRVAAVVLLAVWGAGIAWSRVALGAHYPTDVIGGMLFGLGWLCLTLALARNLGLTARHT
jgi:undecaprenyl-diphosphatase